MSYIGNSPGVASQRVVSAFIATAGQTTFTPISGYTLGYLDVYLNGAKLILGSDYTATDGISVILTNATLVDDTVELVAFLPRGLTDGYTKSEADARYQPVDAELNAWSGIDPTSKLNTTDPSYTGTLTGGTGVVNLGSGQFVKDAAGNVGLGTASPNGKLTVVGNTINTVADNTYAAAFNAPTGNIRITPYNTAYASPSMVAYSAGYVGLAPLTLDASRISFMTGATERARIDASGNLGVGVTPSAWNSDYKVIQLGQQSSIYGRVGPTEDAGLMRNAYRATDGSFKYATNGTAQQFSLNSGAYKWFTAPSGTAGNAISWTQAMTLDANSVLILENSNGQLITGQLDANTAFIQSKTSGGSARAIAFMGASEYGRFDVSGVLNLALGLIARPAVNSGIAFDPAGVLPATATAASDNTIKLGNAAYRWSTVYAGTGTINTSDAREKTAVRVMAADEIEAAKALSKEIGVYQFFDSVAAKGDKARHHIGMTVQRAIEIMKFHGLDPFSYGFICYDKWNEETKEHPAIEAREAVEAKDAVLDDDGNVIEPAVEAQPAVKGKDAWTEVTLKAGDRYSFRYDQLTLFIARGIDARLAALEATR